MFIKSLKLTLIILFLSGCTSSPKEQTQYYLLNQHSVLSDGSLQPKKSELKQINLAKIKLPEYLSQPYLVMQLNDHQLHYASFHLWAESLQSGISKSLQTDLNNINSPFQFNLNMTNSSAQYSLVLEINHFYPTNNSNVILTGKFALLNNQGAFLIPETSFKFSADLEKNGYQNSVSEMRGLINQLSVYLIEKLTSQTSNIN